MNLLKALGIENDKFYDLLEASAGEAQTSVKLLLDMMKNPGASLTLDEFIEIRRKDKRITESIAEELCRTFVTPLDREDIERLSLALYKVPKTVEKFIEKLLLCRDRIDVAQFSPQLDLLRHATETVAQMVQGLRGHENLQTAKEQNDRLHYLEGEADCLMLTLVKDLYSGRHEPLTVIIMLDLYETLEKITDRCRDAGNVVFQVVLKYS